MVNLLIENSGLFRIEQCRSCPVPGYLIVTPNQIANSLAELSPATLNALGPTLARATFLIEKVIDPLNVYCAKFGEAARAVHFHLFPRTAWISHEYQARFGPSEPIHGPHLLDWARETYLENDCGLIPRPTVSEVVQQMRAIATADCAFRGQNSNGSGQ